ncbi:MAG: type I DNA topoisomerase [Candidatus Magasanikbacteria bacterium]|nr:type I DNA topoisomerase [Candidatus Magasanikbacteria bacterium]
MSKLVIVESPAKARTISKFLGRKFVVKSSFGHVRDLPKSKMGVDTANNFEPHYIVSRDKSKIAKELKADAKGTDEILFATDEDREGEAISWHLAQILGVDPAKAKRIVFHEITKTAIEEAIKNPRPLDLKMVDAQQARRVLDRLVGYELSPFLWRKVAKGLSAGRVQSVAMRLTVEREREILAFKPEEYWTVEGVFANTEKIDFNAKLSATPEKKLEKMDITNQEMADKIMADLKGATYIVGDVEKKTTHRNPPPPFTTSTIQQDANNRLGFSAKQTMRLAQQLYEGMEIGSEGSVGLITYMRTDSVNMAQKFLTDAHAVIKADYGDKYLVDKPRTYTNKSKNAQEAHEAIRPTEAGRTPDIVKPFLDKNQFKLYELIWNRAMSTQMTAAEISSTGANIVSQNKYTFRATGQYVVFDGYLKLYPDKNKDNSLPNLENGQKVNCQELKPEQHFTEPPARYNDAALVKALEEHGIGRPSTYAPTIATIEDRGYVERDEKKRLKPRDIAFTVNDLLVQHFPNIVDLEFTAKMEENFDEIARGEKEWQPVIGEFYFPFKENLKLKETEIAEKVKIPDETTDEVCEKCGKPMVIKNGRFGKFMACSGYPDCKTTKNIANLTGVKCPKCGQGDLAGRKSKRGKMFYGCNRYPNCDFALWDKPTGDKCEKCGSLMTQTFKGEVKCSNKECK